MRADARLSLARPPMTWPGEGHPERRSLWAPRSGACPGDLLMSWAVLSARSPHLLRPWNGGLGHGPFVHGGLQGLAGLAQFDALHERPGSVDQVEQAEQ